MKKFPKALVPLVLVFMLVTGAAAQATFASVTNTLIHSGKCDKKENWSLNVLPGPFDAYVPAGKVLKAEGGACSMRSLLLEGNVAGFGPVSIGNSLRAEGPAGADIALKIIAGASWQPQNLSLVSTYEGSPQILDFGPSQISNLTVGGSAHYQLGEAARFESLWTMQEGSWFDTAGYNVSGMGDTQASLSSTLRLHGSEWDTGEWRVATPVALEAGAATVYQDDGSYGITECHGQTLGNLIVRNFRPHLVNSCTIPGTLSLEQTADRSPIVFSGTFLPNERLEPTRLTIGQLATNGVEAAPVVTEGRATIVLPHDEEVTGYLDPSEWTVEGGVLYLPNDPTPNESNSGIVYAPEP